MSDSRHVQPAPENGASADTLHPLPGEPGIPAVTQGRPGPMSRKGILAIALLALSLAAVAALSIQRTLLGGKPAGEDTGAQQPTAAATDPRRLDLRLPAPAAAPESPRIPALVPLPEEIEPIGVRRAGSGPMQPSAEPRLRPEDAPVMIVSTRPAATRAGVGSPPAPARAGDGAPPDSLAMDAEGPAAGDLQAYQRRLQALLDRLTRSTESATRPAEDPSMPEPRPKALAGASTSTGEALGEPARSAARGGASAGLFGGQLAASTNDRVAAGTMGNRSLTLPKGTAFTCALKTKVISATSGLVGCQVQRNVFGDDGRVLLVERGSHLDGEYRIASVRPGTVRIPVLWTRIRTPLGVTVDIDSPGTGPLGESGIDGYVDNRWGERIGAAMLLSLIDDSVKLVIQNQGNDTQGSTVVLPSTTSNTSKLAEKVLDSTINIPPLIYQNQGGIVGIYVARDVDFSSVYELRPVDRGVAP